MITHVGCSNCNYTGWVLYTCPYCNGVGKLVSHHGTVNNFDFRQGEDDSLFTNGRITEIYDFTS